MNRGAESASRLAKLFHSLALKGRPEEKEVVSRAARWHKFIIDPEPLGDQLAPAAFADDLRRHGLFRPPFDDFVIHIGPYTNDAGLSFHGTVFVWLRGGDLYGRVYDVEHNSFKPNSGTCRYPLHLDQHSTFHLHALAPTEEGRLSPMDRAEKIIDQCCNDPAMWLTHGCPPYGKLVILKRMIAEAIMADRMALHLQGICKDQ